MSERVRVSVRLGSQASGSTPSLLVLTLSRESTVSDVKASLARVLDTRPKQDGIVCALGGRVLRDQERLGDLVESDSPRDGDDDEALELNVIVRPSAWTRTPPPPPPPVADSTSSPLSEPQTSTRPATNADEHSTATAPTTGEEGLPPPVPVVQVAPPPSSSESQPAQAGTASNDQPQPRSDNASTATGTPYATYLSYLHRLVPIQRALLLLNLQKAHQWYADRLHGDGEERLQEVEEMLKEVGVWKVVEDAVDGARKDCERWVGGDERQRHGDQEFRVVQIAGLPYLLHTPPELLAAHDPATPTAAAVARHHLIQKRRTAAVHQVLTTMLQLVLTLQTSAPAMAYGRSTAGLRSSAAPGGGHFGPISGAWTGTGLDGRGRPHEGDPRGADAVLANLRAQQRFAPPPPPAGAADAPLLARRPATLSVIINVDAILSLVIPLFLLSLKLAFLLFIFGRHASPSKRIALACIAVLWILYEGWSIHRRRAQAMRERERAERERRRANRAAAAQLGREQAQARAEVRAQAEILGPGGGGDGLLAAAAFQYGRPRLGQEENPPPAPPAPAAAAANPRRRAGTGATTRHHRRTPPSRLSPKYWLNLIAAVGLVAEARELGLSPRSIAGRPVAPPPPARMGVAAQQPRTEALRRGLRNVLIAVVLFFGTLSPEVERKRKKAIDKRERLLAERRAAAAATEVTRMGAMAEEEGQAASSSTRAGVGSEPEPTPAASIAAAGASGSSSGSTATAPVYEEECLRLRRRYPADDAGGEGSPTTSIDTLPTRDATGSPPPSASASAAVAATVPPTRAAIAPPPPPSGRERISDEELFRDGPSEAYLPSRPGMTTTGSAAAATTAEREPAGSETGPNSTAIADPPSAPGPDPPALANNTRTPPFEDDDLASLLSTSASSSAPEEEDEEEEEAGIARRVHARRARMVVARRGGGGGVGGGRPRQQRQLGGGGGGDEPDEDEDDEEEPQPGPEAAEEEIDQVVALF